MAKAEKQRLPAQAQAQAGRAFEWRPHAWRILAVWALALVCYSNSFHTAMVGDDVPVIEGDARVHAATAENFRLAFTAEYWYASKTTGLYRPLTTLSYLFNYAVLGNGGNPAGYHILNFAIHLANIALVYLLGLVLFTDPLPAIALAALWGVHPVLTESVTNLVGRADLLAAFGVLAGLLCHIQAAAGSGRRKVAWLAALSAAAAIGIFSKESGAVLPAAMLLYDFAFGLRTEWHARWAGYAAVAVPFAVFFGLRGEMLANHPVGVVPFVDNPLVGVDFWTARLTALKLIATDFRLLFWPAKLSADYSFHQIPFATWGDWKMLGSAVLCLLAAAIAIAGYRRRKPVYFFLVAFFFAALAPVSNLVIVIGATMAERFLYLPAIGIVGCVVAALCELRRRQALLGIAAILCLAAGARTFTRNFDWTDERSLWTSAVAATPRSFRSHYSLASALASTGQLDGAVRESDEMLRILSPLPDEQNSTRAYELAGECFRRKGDAAGAESAAWYRKALATLLHAEKIGAIEREQIRLVNLAQGKRARVAASPALYLEIGRAYNRLHQPEQAIAALLAGRGARQDPAFAEELSNAYREMGDTGQAAVALIEGLVIDPASTGLAASLEKLYRETAPQSCALKSAAGGASIDLGCPMVHDQVCAASWNVVEWYGRIGQAERAKATAASAVNQLQCSAKSLP
jgi:protein O-mannosyl-transferase